MTHELFQREYNTPSSEDPTPCIGRIAERFTLQQRTLIVELRDYMAFSLLINFSPYKTFSRDEKRLYFDQAKFLMDKGFCMPCFTFESLSALAVSHGFNDTIHSVWTTGELRDTRPPVEDLKSTPRLTFEDISTVTTSQTECNIPVDNQIFDSFRAIPRHRITLLSDVPNKDKFVQIEEEESKPLNDKKDIEQDSQLNSDCLSCLSGSSIIETNPGVGESSRVVPIMHMAEKTIPLVIYAPPYSGKTYFQQYLKKKNINVFDTDEIQHWKSVPMIALTNIPIILRCGVNRIMVIPDRATFNARCRVRNLNVLDSWYDEACSYSRLCQQVFRTNESVTSALTRINIEMEDIRALCHFPFQFDVRGEQQS